MTNLDHAHLLDTIKNATSLNYIAAAHADNIGLTLNPYCLSRHEFSCAAPFASGDIPPGTARANLDSFAQEFVGMSLDQCVNISIPDDLGIASRLDPSPENMALCRAAGVQGIARHLPELIDHVKHLIVRGPLADRLSHAEQAELLTQIDLRFPPTELKQILAHRLWPAGTDPAIDGQYTDDGEAALTALLIKNRMRPAASSANIQSIKQILGL